MIDQFIKESEEELRRLNDEKSGRLNLTFEELVKYHLNKLKQAYDLGRKKKIVGFSRSKNGSTIARYE